MFRGLAATRSGARDATRAPLASRLNEVILAALRHGRLAGFAAQGFGLVGLLPGERRQFAAEVAVAGRLAVDRPAQVERLDDALAASA